MDKVLLLSLASALVTAQQPDFNQQTDFNIQQQQQQQQQIQQQQVNYNQQADYDQQYQPGQPIDPTISFNYGYEINDKETGDAKTHQEALENGVLRGSYSVVQPDGNRRIVEYEADEISGFQAKVRYEPGYPLPPQPRRPSQASVPSQQFAGGASSRGPRPNRPIQGARPNQGAPPNQVIRPHQGTPIPPQLGSRFVGGAAPQQTRFGTPSQGPRFGPGPLRPAPLPVAPARFNPRPSQSQGFTIPKTSSSSTGQSSFSTSSGIAPLINQGRPTGSASPGSRFVPASFPGRPSGSHFIGSSRPAGALIQVPSLPQSAGVGPSISTRLHGGAHGASTSSQSAFASGISQVGQSGSIISGNPTLNGGSAQGISSGSRLQAGPPPAAPLQFASRPRPGAQSIQGAQPLRFAPRPRPGAQSLGPAVRPQNDVAVQIAPSGFFSQYSGAGQASASGAAQAGASGAGSSSISHSRGSSSQFQSNNAASAFQAGPGSRFAAQGGPSFDQLISSSLLVTNENLDNIEAVELASAGFDDSAYAYRLVPVPVNN